MAAQTTNLDMSAIQAVVAQMIANQQANGNTPQPPTPPKSTDRPVMLSVKGGKTVHSTAAKPVKFSLTKTKTATKESFDPVSYYALTALVTICKDGGYKDGPIQCGVVNHPEGAMRDGKSLQRYNGNVVVLGLGRTAEVFSAEKLLTFCEIAGEIRGYIEEHFE